MKQRIWIGLALLLAASLRAEAGASSWTGVWEITQKTDQGADTLYLQIRQEPKLPVLFSANWEPLLLVSSKQDGESLTFNWQPKGFNVLFEGQRSGNRIQGNWRLAHPQYSLTNVFSAKKLALGPDWEPLAAADALASPEAPLNLWQLLIDKAPKTREEFASFWNDSFSHDYYVFLQDAPNAEEVFSLAAAPEAKSKAEQFAAYLDSFENRFAERVPGVGLEGRPVILPFGSGAPRTLQVAERRFFLINGSAFAAAQTDSQQAADFARSLMQVAFDQGPSGGQPLPIQLFREGIPLFFASRMVEDANLHQVLQMPESQLRQLQEKKPEILKGKDEAWANGASRRFFSYDFVRAIIEKHGKLSGLRLQDLAQELDSYRSQSAGGL